MPIAQMDNVLKKYKIGKIEVPALRGVSVSIAEGEFTSIAGP